VLTAAGAEELFLRLSAAEEHAPAKALTPSLLLTFLSGGVDGAFLLELASHAAGACGDFLCIVAACLEPGEHFLSTENLALGLLKLNLVHGELCAGSSCVCVCLGAGIDGGASTDKTLGCATLGICSALRLFVELGKGEFEELVHLFRVTLLTSKDVC